MTKNQILSEIKKIMLKHKGKRNAISAGEIAKMLNLKQEDTHVEPRKYLYEAMKKYGIPIAGGGKGYYIVEDEKELKDYTRTLDNRAEKIKERKQAVQSIVKQYKLVGFCGSFS